MDERLRFVARLLEGEKMAPLCAAFGISRKTGYKIFGRYKDCCLGAFSDRSRRPHRQANRLLCLGACERIQPGHPEQNGRHGRMHLPLKGEATKPAAGDRIWLVTFMQYDLGYFDDETGRLEPIDHPFGPKVLPIYPE
jgi:hypothetical protein